MLFFIMDTDGQSFGPSPKAPHMILPWLHLQYPCLCKLVQIPGQHQDTHAGCSIAHQHQLISS